MAAAPQSPQTKRKVIVAPKTGVAGGRVAPKLFAVGMVSAVLHAGMLLAFYYLTMLIGLGIACADDPKDAAGAEVQIAEEPPDADLTVMGIGLDPGLAPNNPRAGEDDWTVPGPADPLESPGILSDPGELRRNLTPPPGGGDGLGGGPLSLDAGRNALDHLLGGSSLGALTPGGFVSRSGAARRQLANAFGGNAASEAAVARGLKWLALHQAPDGHWSLHEFTRFARTDPNPGSKIFKCTCTGEVTRQNDIAATGFGLLPFLAGGITHKPGKDPRQIDYSMTVKAGLSYLVAKQGADGYLGGDAYAHGIAAIALCEAYGMTSDPLLKTPALKAVRYIEFAQDPAGGGWRYSPKTPGDTSVTGWQVMALKSAQMAGINLYKTEGHREPLALERAKTFLNSVKSADGGGYGYLPDGGETPAMTAVGLLCQQYLGVGPRNPGLLRGAARLKILPPGKSGNIYYEYYATQVMHHMGGDAWEAWNKGPAGDGKGGVRDELIGKQDSLVNSARPLAQKLAHQDGGWGPDAGSLNDGGRIMSTSLSLLTLEVYYRHLPLYRRDVNATKDGGPTDEPQP